jgi:hypothetical protein
MMRQFCLAATALLTAGCAATIHTATSVTYAAPTAGSVDSIAILPVSSGEGLEGFRRMISDSLFTILGRERREIALLPADSTLARINRAGLTAQYATAIRDYQQTSVLNRATIDTMSREAGARYLLYTRAAYDEGRSVSGNFLTGYSSRRDQDLQLHLHVWDGRRGDVVWEALATGKVSAGEFETSRRIDEILSASVRELVAKFLTRPLR